MLDYNRVNQMVILYFVHNYIVWNQEVINTDFTIRVIPKTIPDVEKKLLYSVFLDAVLRFYQDPKNEENFRIWCTEKGDDSYEQENSRYAS